tara:strand:+ start:7837 stop:8682 length:846 start_codon:yes stop_codon:yes gene_type:complete
MKVGVIGLGFVGNALCNGLKHSKVDVIKIDPKFKTTITDLIDFDPNIVFIAVPTPMMDDGSQDVSILKSIINELNSLKTKFLLVLKSTVLPHYLDKIVSEYPDLIYNPEFLRENHADEDFINSKSIIFGGDLNKAKLVSVFYNDFTKCKNKDHIFTDHVSASLIKYAINSFLATKVIFFNELKKIFVNSDTEESWSDFIKAISSDERIGTSHMEVPGPDGRLGFGGPCFPKDTNALIEYSKLVDANFQLLEKITDINNSLRLMYNEPTKREKEQNIKFKKK